MYIDLGYNGSGCRKTHLRNNTLIIPCRMALVHVLRAALLRRGKNLPLLRFYTPGSGIVARVRDVIIKDNKYIIIMLYKNLDQESKQ